MDEDILEFTINASCRGFNQVRFDDCSGTSWIITHDNSLDSTISFTSQCRSIPGLELDKETVAKLLPLLKAFVETGRIDGQDDDDDDNNDE